MHSATWVIRIRESIKMKGLRKTNSNFRKADILTRVCIDANMNFIQRYLVSHDETHFNPHEIAI